MPGQEKMVMDFYQKNPSALASLRGTVYEEKILNLIKEKGKANKKEISKDEAEKILKEAHKHDMIMTIAMLKKKKKLRKNHPQHLLKKKNQQLKRQNQSQQRKKQKKLAKSNLKLYK